MILKTNARRSFLRRNFPLFGCTMSNAEFYLGLTLLTSLCLLVWLYLIAFGG